MSLLNALSPQKFTLVIETRHNFHSVEKFECVDFDKCIQRSRCVYTCVSLRFGDAHRYVNLVREIFTSLLIVLLCAVNSAFRINFIPFSIHTPKTTVYYIMCLCVCIEKWVLK